MKLLRWLTQPKTVAPVRPAPRQREFVFAGSGLCKSYPNPVRDEPDIHAIRNATFEIPRGFVAILGESGSGKTTLLNMLGAIDEPTGGAVAFQDLQIPFGNAAGLREYLRFRVAWIFQELNLIQHLTVADNVALPLLCQGWPRRDARDVAIKRLERLMIDKLAKRKPRTLSRGQMQRVAIARAVCSGAEVILADEPTGSLDAENALIVMKELRDLAVNEGMPVIMVTHNVGLAHDYCTQILRCERGVLVAGPKTRDQLDAEKAAAHPAHSAPKKKSKRAVEVIDSDAFSTDPI